MPAAAGTFFPATFIAVVDFANSGVLAAWLLPRGMDCG